MSHTKVVLVSNDAGATSTSVEAGKLVFFVNDAATASGDLAAIAAGTNYQYMTGEGSSIRFDGANVISKEVQVHVAGTQQVLQVTPVVESDGSAYIKLIDVTDGREKFAIATFEAPAKSGQTAAQAVDLLVDAINASKRDVFKDVEAAENSGDNTIIDITIPLGKIFRGAANDASGAVSIATDAVLPIGTAALVNAEFEDALPLQGVTNLAGPNVVKPANPAVSGTYDRTVIAVKQTVGQREDLHEIVIYTLASNTTLNAALDTHVG
jgi:hypothetical protein